MKSLEKLSVVTVLSEESSMVTLKFSPKASKISFFASLIIGLNSFISCWLVEADALYFNSLKNLLRFLIIWLWKGAFSSLVASLSLKAFNFLIMYKQARPKARLWCFLPLFLLLKPPNLESNSDKSSISNDVLAKLSKSVLSPKGSCVRFNTVSDKSSIPYKGPSSNAVGSSWS